MTSPEIFHSMSSQLILDPYYQSNFVLFQCLTWGSLQDCHIPLLQRSSALYSPLGAESQKYLDWWRCLLKGTKSLDRSHWPWTLKIPEFQKCTKPLKMFWNWHSTYELASDWFWFYGVSASEELPLLVLDDLAIDGDPEEAGDRVQPQADVSPGARDYRHLSVIVLCTLVPL